jgi:hypothetical protein
MLSRLNKCYKHVRGCAATDQENLSWRTIAKKLGIPAMTALDSYRQSAPTECTETVPPEKAVSGGKRKTKNAAA